MVDATEGRTGLPWAGKTTLGVRALLVGERIDLRALETARRIAVAPLTIAAGQAGCAILFRYGAVVLVEMSPLEEAAFLNDLKPFLLGQFTQCEVEDARVKIDPRREEWIENSEIVLHDADIARLQILADILAKSVVLAHYEASVASVFDRVEPLAASLGESWWRRTQNRELLRHIGGTLLIQHKMVGRVEVGEKPEILWDRPELERLYQRLEGEYELSERHAALGRKLDLVGRTAETILNVLQQNHSIRVEWYVVALIVVEILLTLYELFIHPSRP